MPIIGPNLRIFAAMQMKPQKVYNKKKLKEKVLIETPHPSNLDAIKNLAESLHILLCKEHPLQFELEKNTRLSGRHDGPTGQMVEEARTTTDKNDPTELLSSEEVAQTVEKTVKPVG